MTTRATTPRRLKPALFLLLLAAQSVFLSTCNRPAELSDEERDSPKQPDKTNFERGLQTPQPLPDAELDAGWIQLFDGQKLHGFKANSKANWRVENGVLVADSGDAGLLVTHVPFADFEFKCDYRLAKGGNSGVFFRTAFKPTDPAVDCYELNMCDSHASHVTGSLVRRKVVDVKSPGEGVWRTWHVTAKGRRIVAMLDGKQVLDFTDGSKHFLPSGYIGLQYRDGKIEFRNVKLKPLGGKPIFNGKDLTGWKPAPNSKGRFSVTDGAIHVDGGQGYLQTEGDYADFVLQFQAKTLAKDVNTGVFFRTIADSNPADGYELQIHNGFKGKDRRSPSDYGTGFGTGAIFRRQAARWVVPDDKQWFHVTLIAHGNRFATWVNGFPIVSWTDARKPDENSRRGYRAASGRLSLQGHDEGTKAMFRKLVISTTDQ